MLTRLESFVADILAVPQIDFVAYEDHWPSRHPRRECALGWIFGTRVMYLHIHAQGPDGREPVGGNAVKGDRVVDRVDDHHHVRPSDLGLEMVAVFRPGWGRGTGESVRRGLARHGSWKWKGFTGGVDEMGGDVGRDLGRDRHLGQDESGGQLVEAFFDKRGDDRAAPAPPNGQQETHRHRGYC